MNNDSIVGQSLHLREAINQAINAYYEQLEGEPASNVYDMVISQIEPPLLEATLAHTGNNQPKAAEVLGLNRGTLRKKLKQYDLI